MTDLIERGPAAAPVPETMEGLRVQNRAYRTLCASLEAQMAILTEKGREYQEAVTTLDSERAANAILTDENAALRERVGALEAIVERAIRQAQNIGIDSGSYYEGLVAARAPAQQGGKVG